jgi:hypothetical protein
VGAELPLPENVRALDPGVEVVDEELAEHVVDGSLASEEELEGVNNTGFGIEVVQREGMLAGTKRRGC